MFDIFGVPVHQRDKGLTPRPGCLGQELAYLVDKYKITENRITPNPMSVPVII